MVIYCSFKVSMNKLVLWGRRIFIKQIKLSAGTFADNCIGDYEYIQLNLFCHPSRKGGFGGGGGGSRLDKILTIESYHQWSKDQELAARTISRVNLNSKGLLLKNIFGVDLKALLQSTSTFRPYNPVTFKRYYFPTIYEPTLHRFIWSGRLNLA